MNRKQRREAARNALVQQIKAMEFVIQMDKAKEAKTAERLFLERGVKLAGLPDEKARRYVQKFQERRAA